MARARFRAAAAGACWEGAEFGGGAGRVKPLADTRLGAERERDRRELPELERGVGDVARDARRLALHLLAVVPARVRGRGRRRRCGDEEARGGGGVEVRRRRGGEGNGGGRGYLAERDGGHELALAAKELRDVVELALRAALQVREGHSVEG